MSQPAPDISKHTTPKTAPETVNAVQKLIGGQYGVFFVSPPSFSGRTDIPVIWTKAQAVDPSENHWRDESGNETNTIVIIILNTEGDDTRGPTEVSNRQAEGFTAIYIETQSSYGIEAKGYQWTEEISQAVSSLEYQFVYVTSTLWHYNKEDSWHKTSRDLGYTTRTRAAEVLIVVDEAELLYEFAETHLTGGFYRGFPEKYTYRSLQGYNNDVGRRALDYETLPDQAYSLSASVLYLATATCPEHVQLSMKVMSDPRARTITVNPFPGLKNVRFLRYDMEQLDPGERTSVLDFLMRGRKDPRSMPKTIIYSSSASISRSLMWSNALMNGQTHPEAPLRTVHWINSAQMQEMTYADFNADKIPMLTTTPDFGAYTPALGARVVIIHGTWEPTMMWRLAMRVDASRPALVIFMVETNKQCFYDRMKVSFKKDRLEEGEVMNPDQATVAISTTKVCLMVAWSLFFKTSSVPLDPKSPGVLKEAKILSAKCGPCQCSNCKPREAASIYKSFGRITAGNLKAVVTRSSFA